MMCTYMCKIAMCVTSTHRKQNKTTPPTHDQFIINAHQDVYMSRPFCLTNKVHPTYIPSNYCTKEIYDYPAMEIDTVAMAFQTNILQ